MNFNLSKFKKVSEDKSSATLQHPEGHKIVISKNALSPDMRDRLAKLPQHMYEAGEVKAPNSDAEQGDQSAQNPQAPAQPTIIINNGPPQQQAPSNQDYFTNGTFDTHKYIQQSPNAPVESKINEVKSMQADEQAKAAQAQQAQMAEQQKAALSQQYNQMAAQRGLPPVAVPAGAPPAPAPQMAEASPLQQSVVAPQAKPQGPNDPYGTEAYYKNYNAGLGEQKAGLAQEAQAIGAQGQAEAGVDQNAVQQQQLLTKSYQDHFQELNQEQKHFLEDIQNQHIDPTHYMSSMGTGQRVLTAIGLILGGIGGGLTHQENPALKYLNAQIDRDIQAQQSELGKKENLLNANFKQFGNLKDATDMTRVMQSGIVASQLRQEAAKAQDPIAKARALQAAGKLDEQAAPVLSQMAMRRTLLGGVQSGQMNPGTAVRMIVPENMQKDAYKELGDAQMATKGKDLALGAFDKIAQLNTIGNRVGSPLQSKRQIDAVMNPTMAELAKQLAGRFTEQDFKILRDSFPILGDDEKTLVVKKAKLNSLMMKDINTPILSSYGINVGASSGPSRYDNSGQKKLQLGPVQAP